LAEVAGRPGDPAGEPHRATGERWPLEPEADDSGPE